MEESESTLGSIRKKWRAMFVHPDRLEFQAGFLIFHQIAGLLFAQPRDRPLALIHTILG